MIYRLRYFLFFSLLLNSFGLSAQTTQSLKNDERKTRQELDRSMRSLTKRIKRYYACVMGECSQQEIRELQDYIWSDAALLVTTLTTIGLGSYVIYSKVKLNPEELFKSKEEKEKTVVLNLLIKSTHGSLQEILAADKTFKLDAPQVAVKDGGIVISYLSDMPDKETVYRLTEKIRVFIFGRKLSYTGGDAEKWKKNDREYGPNFLIHIADIPFTIKFKDETLDFTFQGSMGRGFLDAHHQIFNDPALQDATKRGLISHTTYEKKTNTISR